MTVGDRIRAAREARDMTQEELGKICGVKKQTIFKYENNIITNIPFDKLKLISKGLKVSVPKLMDWETEDGSIDLGIAQYETGLSEYEVEDLISAFPPQDQLKSDLSEKEKVHIKKYRSLDQYGKEAVDGVLDVESRRCEAARTAALCEQGKQTEMSKEIAPEVYFIVPGFTSPMSAGTGQIAGDDYSENYRLVKEPPRGTSYIAPIDGNSMEPTYQNGDRLFIHACTNIRKGQIGIFFMDGMQWVKELGNGVLISHNENYEPLQMTDDIVCQGLVLGVCDDSYFE